MSVARSALVMLAAFVVAAVLDYAFGAGMAWMLSPADYGALSVAMTYFLLLSFFVASGFPMSLAKFLAERGEEPRWLVRDATAGNVAVAIVVVALFLALTFYGPLSPGPGYGRLVWGVALAVLLLSAATPLHFALQGRMRFTSFALLHASKSLNKVLWGIGLVALGWGIVGAISGLVIGGLALLALAAWLLARGPPVARGPPLGVEERREFRSYTASVFAGSFALTLLMSLDLLAVKYLTPAADSNVLAAHYQSASILTKAPLWAVIAGLSILFPLMSRASREDPARAERLLRATLRWMLVGLAPLTLLLVVFPTRVLALVFPPDYAAASLALAVNAVGMAALALCFVLTRALQATGRASAPGAYLAVSAGLQVALLFALVPRYGIFGAALASTIACIAGMLLAFAGAARVFDLGFKPRDILAQAVSLAVLVAVVDALRVHGRGGVVLALGAGMLAYAASLLLLGVVTREERRMALRRVPLVGRRFASAPPEPEL